MKVHFKKGTPTRPLRPLEQKHMIVWARYCAPAAARSQAEFDRRFPYDAQWVCDVLAGRADYWSGDTLARERLISVIHKISKKVIL